jgi:elongation factor Ts
VEVTVEQVKELRGKTGAGMMDCKKALMESDGDFEKAIEYLRKKGSATSQKRIDRIAKEGLIVAETSGDRKEVVIAEVNCETDFVARSDDFKSFTNSIISALMTLKTDDMNVLLNYRADGRTIQQAFDELLGKVGEKIEIKRVKYLKSGNGFFNAYNHVGNKIASVIELSGTLTDEGANLGNDLAMQVVAMKPIAIYRSEISEDVINKEKDIYLTLARNEKKPENIAEKIAANKVEKFFQENCLVEQEFVKEQGKSVSDIISAVSKQVGQDYKVVKMLRFQLGETLEN